MQVYSNSTDESRGITTRRRPGFFVIQANLLQFTLALFSTLALCHEPLYYLVKV